MNSTQLKLAEQAQPKLGEALAEHALTREAQNPGDKEHRKYLLNDLNDLLQAVSGPGAELQAVQFNRPTQLQSHLEASLELPAQVLAKELPRRLTTWLQQEPSPQSPQRAQWVEQGRFLLDQARLRPSSLA